MRLRYQIELIENSGVREEFNWALDKKESILCGFLNEHCSSAFYHAYEACFPLTDAYPVKKQVFNLYHYLNHYIDQP